MLQFTVREPRSLRELKHTEKQSLTKLITTNVGMNWAATASEERSIYAVNYSESLSSGLIQHNISTNHRAHSYSESFSFYWKLKEFKVCALSLR